MQKKQRQNALLSIIGSVSVHGQKELSELLREAGFSVTQASISRDLGELGVVKLNGAYILPQRDDSHSEFGQIVLDRAGDNLIVARCASGLASAITVKIDAADIKGIVGTIAGDDTIFVAVHDAESQNYVTMRIADMFP